MSRARTILERFDNCTSLDPIKKVELLNLERYLDNIFKYLNIDVDLGKRHFFDRINDRRNQKQITLCELKDIFMEIFKKYGKGLTDIEQGVLKDISTNLNIPFVIKWDFRNQEFDLVATTIMRKSRFHTRPQDTVLSIST